MGRTRRGRDIHGLLLLDKPTGISSNAALQKVKRLFSAKKAGHTGALDPLATGMLPICLGESTKFSQFLLDSDKCYRVIAKLGQRTNTSDSEGEIIAERSIKVTLANIERALIEFRGKQQQIPSMYSALKYHGRPLYDYARKGIEIERQARAIEIYRLTLIRFETNEIELEVHCSKGTYIRTLIDDLGEKLGCGAHVIMLRRLQVANYPTEKMVTLDALEKLMVQNEHHDLVPYTFIDRCLLPMDSTVLHLPEVNIAYTVASYLKQGQVIQSSHAPKVGLVRITEGDEHHFIGIGEVDDIGRISPKRLIVTSS